MFVEIDMVAVDEDLWAKVRCGVKEAVQKLRKDLDGMELYMHALSTLPSDTCVTLEKLERAHVIETVTIKTKPKDWGYGPRQPAA